MKKIAIPFCILCLALLVGLTACNNQNDSGKLIIYRMKSTIQGV